MIDEPEEILPSYSPDGVDLTLIRWFLALTLEERLNYVQDAANCIESMRALTTDA